MTSLTWSAGRDGIAHASPPGHALALCGVRSHDPRWAWPTLERCAACLVIEAGPHLIVGRADRGRSTAKAPTSAGAAPPSRPVASVPPAGRRYLERNAP